MWGGGKEEKKTLREMWVPQSRSLGPQGLGAQGRMCFLNPLLPSFIFCTNIKMDSGPPGPSNYHPSPSSP